jgi:predicted nucleic acid-binding protein
MNKILVDSSVWIAFLKGTEEARPLFQLLDSNQLCTNDLIMAELIPSLSYRKESILIGLLSSIEKLTLDIDWHGIIQMQTNNLKNGINRVGIPDLIIAQNAVQNGLKLFSLDKHFVLMRRHMKLKTFEIG